MTPVERGVQRTHRRRLGHLADLRRRRVLALGQPVDPIIEQQDRDVDIAPHRVNQVVAPDRKGIAVTGDHPNREVFAGQRETGRNCRSAPVDRVEAIGLEVVREAARAADPADEHDVLATQPQLRQEIADGVENDVVATAGAPADLLVAGEIFALLWLVGGGHSGVLGQNRRYTQVCASQIADHASHERRSSSSPRSASSRHGSCAYSRFNRGRRQLGDHHLVLLEFAQSAGQRGPDEAPHLVGQERDTLDLGD